MKRGFLKKSESKGKYKLLAPQTEQADSVQKEVDTEKDVESDKSPVTSNSSRAGDSKQRLLDLHKAPAGLAAKTGKTRFVFREWPRDPEGPVIRETPRGKEASNGLQLWGATLFDFYMFRRSHTIPNLCTFSTGSKLAAHMHEIGELKWAEDEIHWASREADPAEIPPCDIGELIKDNESLIMKGVFGQPIERSEGQETVQPTGASASEKASVFDLPNYPPPWPIVPFSARTARLQKRIPFHLLPQTLIVHDPWDLLSVNKQDTGSDSSECGDAHDAKEWNPKDDIIRTYHLQLSESGKEKVENELKLRADLDAKCKDIGQRESYTHTLDPMTESEPVSPMVMVFPPLCPPPPESVPEAHLYLSPAHHVGSGNHSVVYNAEWELPRSLLVNDILCQQCMRDKVAEELKEMEKRGEYCPGKPEGDSQQRDPGESPRPAVTRDNKFAKVTTTTEQFSGTAAEIVVGGEPLGIYTIEPPEIVHRTTYDGPVVKVFPEVHWQNPEHGLYCAHIQKSLGCEKVPLTAKVNVVAKLSIQHDPHLANEAENYQSFPTYLSEHWNGYNIIPPLHDPVPVGAVVPQFYGYYVPEQNELGDGSVPTYLSPILLLENCGIPIDPKLIDRDEQQECAALLYRMHEAGWAHGSFYERNILVQPGPLSEWPLIRSASGVKSFRLIDFGRSKELRDSKSRAFEETYADRLFDITGFYHPR